MLAILNRSAEVLLVLGLVFLLGCAPQPEESLVENHAWHRPPHNFGEAAVMLAPWLVYPVHPTVREEAIEVLEDVSYIQLSPSMASHYSQSDIRPTPQLRPFLVRALDGGNSEFSVRQSALALWVDASAGDGDTITPQPVVVLLDPTPVGIFVTVGHEEE